MEAAAVLAKKCRASRPVVAAPARGGQVWRIAQSPWTHMCRQAHIEPMRSTAGVIAPSVAERTSVMYSLSGVMTVRTGRAALRNLYGKAKATFE